MYKKFHLNTKFLHFDLKKTNNIRFKNNVLYSSRLISSSTKNEEYLKLISKIRNIGVIAHVDAGKTTTTERMLYYSGFIKNIGNVDDGNTVMDYMDQERERGITITSAAITFPWIDHQFNLIDTPGHVDFTFEVERSLRVLDGAIAVLDGSAGVEAQTLTVWRQANKYKIPRIAYINKMDKVRANFEESVKSIEEKLNTTALPVQMPIGKEKNFTGVVDLIKMKKLVWNKEKLEKEDGKIYQITDISKDDNIYESALKKRIFLIEKLAQVNEKFAEVLLDKFNFVYEKMNDNILLENCIRKSCLDSTVIPVLCGSSFKNIAVQPLMDAIVKYLPSPIDLKKNNFEKYYDNHLFLVCFKIMHDHQKSRKRINSATSIASLQTNASSILNKTKIEESENDILSFVRVYNGDLIAKSKIYNPNKNVKEICDKIYIPLSNQLKQVSKLSAGNIAIVNGLTKTNTGDILVGNKLVYEKAIEKLKKENDPETNVMHISLDIPPPVYFCTVEPESEAEEKRLNFALECLEREDPSLKVLMNEEENLGQTIIQGQGELHLDIIKDRILKEYKLKAYFGPLNISYKEMPTKTTHESFFLEKSIGEKKNSINLELTVIPKKEHKFDTVKLISEGENNFYEFPIEYLNSINHGVKSALNKGVLLRYPFVNTDIHLTKFNASRGVSLPYISSAAYQCTMNALKNSECVIIQPIMQVEIFTTKEFSSRVYSDLTRRNGTNIVINELNEVAVISAKVPLAKLSSYSSEIRRITSGNTTFRIEFVSYEQITQKEFQELLEKKMF